MKFNQRLIAILLFFLPITNPIQASNIKHIFIDINVLIKTSQSSASKIVGIINAMKYTAAVGHVPGKYDFFNALRKVPAQSTQISYNEDLVMPGILCDWLLNLQSNAAIKQAIYQYLDKSSYSDIEKTIYKNISSMMLSPKTFIDTQYLHMIKDFVKLFQTLKKAGYDVHIIGNWDKESEPYLLKLMHSHHMPTSMQQCYFSCKAKELKPNPEYFNQLLQTYKTTKHECVIVDIEKMHTQKAKEQGFTSILLHSATPTQLKSELARIGIRL